MLGMPHHFMDRSSFANSTDLIGVYGLTGESVSKRSQGVTG
jgi:hypothetical protein